MIALRSLTLAAMLLAAGCASRSPLAWRVEQRTIAPPGRPRLIVLKPQGECPAAEPITALHKGRRTILNVNQQALGRQPAGWLADWASRAEESGCIPTGQWPTVAGQVLNAGPLALNMRYRLLHADHARSGYVDLGPENRLEVITPLLREGAVLPGAAGETTSVTETPAGLAVTTRSSPGLVGVETTWYAVRESGIEPVGAPPRRVLFAGLRAHFWRLVYKADQSSVLVAAESRREVEQATAKLNAEVGECAQCVAVPRSVAVNPYLAVLVNGSEVRSPVGSSLNSVIRAAGKKPQDVMPTLAIAKSFNGKMVPVKFERTNMGVLDLVLEGNEVVTW